MHNPVAHSPVSDALVTFATTPLADHRAQAAAGRAVSQARASVTKAGDAGRQIADLLQSQGGAANDARVRAWVLGASDDEIAAAAAIGIEAAARVLAAVDSEEFRSRWKVASAVGILGAALAVSRLLKLDDTRTRHALGVAATQAAGLARNAGEPMAAIETGKAAADAFEAASITEGLGTRWLSFNWGLNESPREYLGQRRVWQAATRRTALFLSTAVQLNSVAPLARRPASPGYRTGASPVETTY
jgi:hypothetical protein